MIRRLFVLASALASGAAGWAPHWNLLARTDQSTVTNSSNRWPSGLHLGVDYYPSQWPEYMWEPDISRMRDANISYVRINEFDWAVLEPEEGQYNFTVLDKTIELLGKYGLEAIVGTPTAAPPNWLTEKYDVAFVDRTNATLIFGSRRHYSFSSFDYRNLSQGITTKLAQRYRLKREYAVLEAEFGWRGFLFSDATTARRAAARWLLSGTRYLRSNPTRPIIGRAELSPQLSRPTMPELALA